MSSNVRLALFSVGELFGGVERHLLGMCTWLQRQGVNPLLILFYDHELAHQARAVGLTPIILPTHGRFDLQSPHRLAELLAGHNVNLVHAHGYKAMVTCALARRHYRFHVVRTVHGLIEPAGFFSLARYKDGVYAWLENQATRYTGAAVCFVTEDLQNRYGAVGQGPFARTVHNGIDPLSPEGYESPADLSQDCFNILAVGRVTAVKGLSTALKAMESLDPALNVVLSIVGTGPLVGPLQAEAVSLGIEDRVNFLGFRTNVYDYLAHAQALIMPSLHEGLPYTILEAMSLGLPIIASSVGGLGEVLSTRETALLVEAEQPACLARAMESLARDSTLANTIAGKARQLQAERFTLSTMCERYMNLYREVVNNA